MTTTCDENENASGTPDDKTGQPRVQESKTDTASAGHSRAEQPTSPSLFSYSSFATRMFGTNPKRSLIRIALIAAGITFALGSVGLNLLLWHNQTSGAPLSPGPQWLLILALLIVMALSFSLNFWLYYIRNLPIQGNVALVPEKWGLYLNELGATLTQTEKQTSNELTRLTEEVDTQSERTANVLESFLKLQEVISNREAEIERLKRGHDTMVFKRFLNKFIRVSTVIDGLKSDQEDNKDYRYLSQLMKSALEDCGVEAWNPELGSDYRQVDSRVADDPGVLETDDATLDWTIAKIDSDGYVVEGTESFEVLIPAKVSIYRTTIESAQEGDKNE